MANILYANNAAGTLAAGITNVAASLTLNAGQGTAFPSPVPPQVFYVTLTDAATQSLIEIVKVTAKSGDVFSITRAQDGTSALSWNAGDIVSQRTIALELRGFENAAEGLFSAQNVPVTPSTTLGIVGTTVGDNANPGSVGEYISQAAPVFGVTSGVSANYALINLAAGDWDVTGTMLFTPSAGATLTAITTGISPVTLTLPGFQAVQQLNNNFVTGLTQVICTPTVRVNINVTTPYYLVSRANFTGGTCSGQGFLSARRVR